ncbi:MAG: uL15 family ribosomal protein [Patescibacteria group bacterium]
MNLSKLPKITHKKKKRRGRGYAGRGGHVTGRGQKGQLSRSGGGPAPTRDYGKEPGFEPLRRKNVAEVQLSQLNVFEEGATLTPENLVAEGIIDKVPQDGVKILKDTDEIKELVLKNISCSESAREVIESSGGEVL